MYEVLKQLYDNDYSDCTRNTYVTMLKKFYRWKLKELPDFIKEMKVRVKENGKEVDDLLTSKDVTALIENSKNARDRALFSVLYDSGCRIGELVDTP